MKAIVVACLIMFGNQAVLAATLNVVRGELGSGRIYVPCTFDGHLQSCFVDTGATFSSVADMEKFGSYSASGKIRFKSASGLSREADEITIRSLQIDTSNRSEMKVARFDSREGFESVIGIDAIRFQPFAFQFSSIPTLTLDPRMPESTAPGVIVYEKGVFSVPVFVGDSRLRGLWDTGAGLTSVDIEYVGSHSANFDFVTDVSNGSDATGSPVVMKLYRAREIRIGGRIFRNENVLAFNFDVIREHIAQDISLIVGFNLIAKANWYFNLQKLQWSVQ